MRHATLFAIVFTVVCVGGCSSSPLGGYTEVVKGEPAKMTVHNTNADAMKNITVKVDLAGKAEGELLKHAAS